MNPGLTSEYPDWTLIPDGIRAFWPDAHAGRIILAKCLADSSGADVYVANGNFMGEEMPNEMEAQLIERADFYKRLIPFSSVDIPITLPDSRPSILSLMAQPIICLVKDERMMLRSDPED